LSQLADGGKESGAESWTHSGVLTGLDEGDPEVVFFHDVTKTPPGS
jgi:hypothetical protein